MADAGARLGARADMENYGEVWDLIDYPRLLFNTIAIAIIGMIGTLLSCTLVAYGFARFRFPAASLLFMILIATIFLPAAVTLIPTYTIFVKLGWVGTWLPLLVPTFFANAYDVFLLRQYFMTIPRDLDEAAAIDGAGPFRTLLLGRPAAGLAGDRRGRDLPLRLLVEQLLRAADLPVGEARAADDRARALPVQQDPLPQPGVHPGGNDHDADHPGHCCS